MATTTNYSWSTPDDTALVKDGAAAIRSLGTAIDTTVFNNAGAAIAKTIVDAKGDIIAATAADTVARLAVGANNTVLTADSSTATGLKWAAPAGGGKVLQVVNFTITTSISNTTTSYNDSGLELAITPSSATSKVLVLTSLRVSISRAVDDIYGQFQLLRGATSLQVQQYGAGNSDGIEGNIAYAYLDSPATTSSTTYKIQGKLNTAANSAGLFYNGDVSTITLLEIGA